MMNIEDFANYIADEAYKVLSDELDVTMMNVRSITKNNGVERYSISPERQGDKVCPNIYLDELFKVYQGGEEIENCVDSFLSIVRQTINTNKSLEQVGEFFRNYDKVKNNLQICVINTMLNKELLKDTPHIVVEDVSLVFRFVVNEPKRDFGSILIKDAHLKIWGINELKLFEDAKLCTQRNNTTTIQSMGEVIRGIVPPESMTEEMEREFMSNDMYVVSNKSRLFGAAEAFYNPSILRPLANAIGDLYVIPSSVHELIVVSKDSMSYSECAQMIKAVNSEEIRQEDILSDHPYVYNAKTHELSMFDTTEIKKGEVTTMPEQKMVGRKH